MKVFNIEDKNGKKEYVCYIQLKDIYNLEDKGINLETTKNINKYMYVFSKSTNKSFVRVEIISDIAKIRENSEDIIDLGEVLSRSNLTRFSEELRKEKEDLDKSMNNFWDKYNGVYKGYLKDEPLYNEWREKGKRLKNKLEDLKDIADILKGESVVNLPQEPFHDALFRNSGNISIYRGINPNEYIIINKDGSPFSEELRSEVKKCNDTEISSKVVPISAMSVIYRDLTKKYGTDSDIEFHHMISADNKYIIVRTKNRIKKNRKTMELVK